MTVGARPYDSRGAPSSRLRPGPSPAPASPLTGYPRPELLASTEWLADNLDRPDVRILDVRWRPDGTARSQFGVGHVPGAVHLDWAAELIERPEGQDSFLLTRADKA